MSEKAVFQGSYADLKFIKGRKVAQVVIEIPIERADAFVKTFGAPQPAAEVPVAIARLVPEAEAKAKEPTKEKQDFSEYSPSQRAGMLCKTVAFQKFMNAADEAAAAEALRLSCKVSSRSRLDVLPGAKKDFEKIEANYSDWLNGPVV